LEELPIFEEGMSPRIWGDVGIGVVLAFLCRSVSPLDQVLSTLLIIFHELGHAACGWTFGYPGFPAFDLRYGGGVTAYQSQSWILLGLIQASLVWCIWMLWRNPRGRFLAFCLLGVHAIFAYSYLHRALFSLAGHGGELLLAGIFLYRGLSGVGLAHEYERPLSICIGSYVVLRGMSLAWNLMYSPIAIMRYQNAKGGGHWMDFSRLAEKYFHVPLEAVAGGFLFACLMTPVVVLLIFLKKNLLHSWWWEALETRPNEQ
jgi:hypothetical protein